MNEYRVEGMRACGTPGAIKSVIWVRVGKNGTDPGPCLVYSVSLGAQYIACRSSLEIVPLNRWDMEVGIRQGQTRPQL